MLRPHIVYMIEYVTLFKINPSGVETVIFWKKGTHTKQKKKKKAAQFHSCRCPGSLRRQDNGSHGIYLEG